MLTVELTKPRVRDSKTKRGRKIRSFLFNCRFSDGFVIIGLRVSDGRLVMPLMKWGPFWVETIYLPPHYLDPLVEALWTAPKGEFGNFRDRETEFTKYCIFNPKKEDTFFKEKTYTPEVEDDPLDVEDPEVEVNGKNG